MTSTGVSVYCAAGYMIMQLPMQLQLSDVNEYTIRRTFRSNNLSKSI